MAHNHIWPAVTARVAFVRSGWIVPVICVLILVASCVRGHSQQVRRPSPEVCERVRQNVATWGEAVVIAWARARGHSAAEIKAARRCLAR